MVGNCRRWRPWQDASRKGDTLVQVISGKDRGKQGASSRRIPARTG